MIVVGFIIPQTSDQYELGELCGEFILDIYFGSLISLLLLVIIPYHQALTIITNNTHNGSYWLIIHDTMVIMAYSS